jgi:hypothetical protein
VGRTNIAVTSKKAEAHSAVARASTSGATWTDIFAVLMPMPVADKLPQPMKSETGSLKKHSQQHLVTADHASVRS